MRRPAPVAGYCPLFSWSDEGVGHCAGHTGVVPEGEEDPYYMQGCVVWPQSPDEIAGYPSCTYTFAWVADAN